MPDLRQIKNRMNTVKSTKKITKAMYLISASRMNKARNLLKLATPYVTAFSNIASYLRTVHNNDNISYLIITSDRGMCGSFNSTLIKFAALQIQSAKEIIFVGRSGYSSLKGLFKDKDVNLTLIEHNKIPEVNFAKKIASLLVKKNQDIRIIYTEFISVIKNLPSMLSLGSGLIEGDKSMNLEPSDILDSFYIDYINSQIYRALIHSTVSEHSTRMRAMDSASKNSLELLECLNTQYNRQRQAIVTRELIEVVSGAEAI
ncbi:ATP synthase gamma chain [Candidatus Cyrtobacter comes]|uniref:ATP synthase gamma chain n=1 Tax=Candidatus Cyrtobacter comes TaxID=675776 RepID=A0ABU5L702_9RICK|nr:F0F1 ATP synthase subunit gamma [Candidatus Cyrtobacter comes]MDZ5761907.1 ATP synthase gamma chain [Candidatus Cyrtobacter comes]